MADDVLGVTTHDDPPNPPTSVRTANDKVGSPFLSLSNDLITRLIAHRFDESRIDRDAGATYSALARIENDLSGVSKLVNDPANVHVSVR